MMMNICQEISQTNDTLPAQIWDLLKHDLRLNF